ncbi:MAG: hypothetical protein KAQ98_09135 [Bacteriovoracaceae bacterium]|nr:hypothetical protein [Bacteriovoracaceae bacterium]
MNRISTYIFLTVVYLVLSMSFSHSEKRTFFIRNEKVFSNYFKGTPITVILVDAFRTGFLIKTYYHKYKIIHGFKVPEDKIVRISKEFWKKNLKNLGMSLFRRSEKGHLENVIPMPPGLLYLGDHFYGRWKYINSGEKIWVFHRGYKHFPDVFGWGDFVPNFKFFKKSKIAIENEKSFYGLHDEFGTNGNITKKFLVDTKTPFKNIDKVKHHLKKFMSIPWTSSNTKKSSSQKNSGVLDE